MIRIIVTLSLSCLLANHAFAQQADIDISRLVRLVVTTEGEPTEQTYNRFWKAFDEATSNQESQVDMITVMRGQLALGMELQVEGWKSVKISYQSGEPVETIRYQELEDLAYPEFERAARSIMTPSEYQQFMTAFKPGWDDGRRNFATLFDSASKHEMPILAGEKIPLSLDYIEQVLGNVEPGFQRVKLLLTPRQR